MRIPKYLSEHHHHIKDLAAIYDTAPAYDIAAYDTVTAAGLSEWNKVLGKVIGNEDCNGRLRTFFVNLFNLLLPHCEFNESECQFLSLPIKSNQATLQVTISKHGSTSNSYNLS